MNSKKGGLRIGYFEHWTQPPCKVITFMQKELGLSVTKINYKQPHYLENFDVVIIEQNGFNDYIENDETYFRDFIKCGGICWFMHQDYRRWAPYFIPEKLRHTNLIHRYITTIGSKNSVYKCYMMPTVENAGRRLFSEPNKILPEEMIYWEIRANSFGIVPTETGKTETVKSSALSCVLVSDTGKWEILGSYLDPGVKDGALILQAKYGKGLYFWNQILFPEELDENSPRILAFWKKYIENTLAHFSRFKAGDTGTLPPLKQKLAQKRNYKMAIHLHSLEWYGADNSLGTIQAMMRYKNYDIASIAVKDAVPYRGKLDIARYSDDRVLFLHGQEYHPFNWNDSSKKARHNTYHMLAIGTDADAYTPEFTKSIYNDTEVADYLEKAIKYVHDQNGAVCATHPYCDYWMKYDYDAVDKEPLTTICGSDIEKFYLAGGKITMMNSVDLFGAERLIDNPASNFIYVEGEPTRDSIVAAIKAGRCIAAAYFSEADIAIGKHLPGDTIDLKEALNSTLKISAVSEGCLIKEVRVYSAEKLIFSKSLYSKKLDLNVPLKDYDLKTFVRVEISGETREQIAVSTPFYLR